MHYHHWLRGVQDDAAYRELKERFTRFATEQYHLNMQDRLTSPQVIGLPYRSFQAVRIQASSLYYAPVGEVIDKLARSMSRTLLTIQIPDGTWIAHRPQIMEAVNQAYADAGVPEPTASPSHAHQLNLRLAMNWTQMSIQNTNAVRRQGAVFLETSGYSSNPGILVSARTARKVVL